MAKKVTIKEIAEQAGVSITTASFIINGNENRYRLKQETVDRVRAVIQQHGFQPNFGAQVMKTGKSHTIAFLAPIITDGFYNRIVVEMEKLAHQRGYKLIMGNTLDQESTEEEYINALLHRQIDGFAIVPVNPKANHLKRLKDSKKPVAIFTQPKSTLPGLFTVDFDLDDGIRQAVNHLVANGCKRIAVLQWMPRSEKESSWTRLQQGLKKTFEESINSAFPKRNTAPWIWPLFGELPNDSDGENLVRLIKTMRADALIVMRSEQIHRAWRHLIKSGIKVPEELKIVACDDKPANRDWYPNISAVTVPKEEVGRLILKQLTEKTSTRGGHVFPVQLEPRESSSTQR